MMRATDMALALDHLHPPVNGQRRAAVIQQPDGSGLLYWHLPTPQPTEAELLAALPAALAQQAARQEMNELQTLLDERYALWSRAQASGNTVDASEIQGEIQSILAYMQEVRNAAGTP